ncbi:MAG: SRPBCC family protein [Candidatus Kariarchaeaceae archaeon]
MTKLKSITSEIQINVPTKQLWDILTDLEGMHNWAPTVHVTFISGVVGLGTKYSTTSFRRSGGEHVSIRSTERSFEITSWEKERRIKVAMIQGKGLVQPLQTEWTLQPDANSTIISLTLNYKITMWIFGKLMSI